MNFADHQAGYLLVNEYIVMVLNCEEDGLVFRTSDHTPDVVSQVLLERGWIEYDEIKNPKSEGSWNLWWKTQRFRKSEHDDVAPWQRLNHFPHTDAITRKDCLVRNLRRMRCVHGNPAFNFHPAAYILPNEYTKFVTDYSKDRQKSEKKDAYWICKPVDLSRGRGIFVFHDLKDLSYDCSVIVQRYITNPFLISGYKFDIRIYVCVPSFQPLTIYMYQEGIVRFGTDKFDLNQLKNVFSHLTNTSINKYGPAYSTDKERVGPGCKWTLSQLRSYLRQLDAVDEMLLWFRICNIITCTLATQAPSVPKCRSCFEVFGFDILIDEQMKPWLLEVNFSPALSMDCQADFIAKRAMINDLIDLLNFKEGDREHGGASYRNCSTPSSSKNPYSRFSFSRRSPKPTPRLSESKAVAGSKSFSVLPKKSDSKCASIPTSKSLTALPNLQSKISNEKEKKRDWNRRKSDTKFLKAKHEERKESLYNNPSKSISSPQLCETPTIPTENFRRNLSSNSVASSISSVDHSNQPEVLENTDESEKLKVKRLPNIKTEPAADSLHGDYDVASDHSDTSSASLAPIIESQTSQVPPLRWGTKHSHKSNDLRLPIPQVRTVSPKFFRKKKSITSAPETRQTKGAKKLASSSSSKIANGKPKLKIFANYKSPYSISNTATQRTPASNPWPRTRVGDFILTFPLNDTMRKASGTNFDMKVIIKEQQKILKKLSSISSTKKWDSARSDSISFTSEDALHLSFQLKFEDKEQNPFYFWGPQNPPLLSRILS